MTASVPQVSLIPARAKARSRLPQCGRQLGRKIGSFAVVVAVVLRRESYLTDLQGDEADGAERG